MLIGNDVQLRTFEQLGELVFTGPTGTNVRDLHILLSST
jgi:glycerate-2-kinase